MDVLGRLLQACETDEQAESVREAAIRARMLWRCDAQGGDCGWVNEVHEEACGAGPGCPGRRPFPHSDEVAEVFCNSGEQRFVLRAEEREATLADLPFECEAETLCDVVRQACNMLDGAYLTNVVVVRTKDGRHHVGEFMFILEEVSAEEARQTARDFSIDEEEG